MEKSGGGGGKMSVLLTSSLPVITVTSYRLKILWLLYNRIYYSEASIKQTFGTFPSVRLTVSQ